MKRVTIRFGTDTFNREYPQEATISTVIHDRELKMMTGHGDNVRALVGGVEQGEGASLVDGTLVVLETRANTKATA